MEGRIYICGAFNSLEKSKCRHEVGQLDNDPHFWESPPTWGICRPDYQNTILVGDYAFYVLPKSAPYPQMIFAYLKVKEKTTHEEAYKRPELKSKRMSDKNPNGNIIVDANGDYNVHDKNMHRDRFKKIKKNYIIGDEKDSELLTENKISTLEPEFMNILKEVFKKDGEKPYDIISKAGRRMNEKQVHKLLNWLKQ